MEFPGCFHRTHHVIATFVISIFCQCFMLSMYLSIYFFIKIAFSVCYIVFFSFCFIVLILYVPLYVIVVFLVVCHHCMLIQIRTEKKNSDKETKSKVKNINKHLFEIRNERFITKN